MIFEFLASFIVATPAIFNVSEKTDKLASPKPIDKGLSKITLRTTGVNPWVKAYLLNPFPLDGRLGGGDKINDFHLLSATGVNPWVPTFSQKISFKQDVFFMSSFFLGIDMRMLHYKEKIRKKATKFCINNPFLDRRHKDKDSRFLFAAY